MSVLSPVPMAPGMPTMSPTVELSKVKSMAGSGEIPFGASTGAASRLAADGSSRGAAARGVGGGTNGVWAGVMNASIDFGAGSTSVATRGTTTKIARKAM